MDVSSAQPRDLSTLIRVHQPGHVVVKLYQRIENIPQSYSVDQINSARANGCSAGGYVWLYKNIDPAQQVQQAIAVAESAGLTLPILWVDIETYQGEAPRLSEAEAACEAADRLGMPVGIYTGNWYVQGYWGGQIGELASRFVWLADYDGREGLTTPSPYWPVAMIRGHQYTSNPVDLSAFAREVTER